MRVAVIEGDLETENDAGRIRRHAARAALGGAVVTGDTKVGEQLPYIG